MNPTNLRFATALAVGVLALDTFGYRPPAQPLRRPVAESRAAAAAPDLDPPKAPAPARPQPQGSRPRAVAIGEPSGNPALERTTRRVVGALPGSFRAMFPAQAAATRSGARGGNHWALIVGINDYEGSTRDNIGSYQDASALRDYLLRLGWRSDHIALLANRAATRSRLVEAIQWLASKTDAASTVVFHYSGHEKPFGSDVDGDSESRDVALWLADNRLLVDGDLGKLLREVQARRMWLNFAVCRAGGFNDPGTSRSGRLVTYSSAESELSYEDPEVEHSVFGYYSIVEGLRSGYADANADGVTTVQEAFGYARPRVEERTGGMQHPQIKDEAGGGLSLVPPAPPPPPPPPSPSPTPSPTPTPSPCTTPVACDRLEPS